MSTQRLRVSVIGAGGFFDTRAAEPMLAASNIALRSVMVRGQARAGALAERGMEIGIPRMARPSHGCRRGK